LSSVKEEILVRMWLIAIWIWSDKVPQDFDPLKIALGLPGGWKTWRDETAWKN
jgi:hypothetical protein